MLILGIESSTEKASCCLMEDKKIIVNIECNIGLTHSQTLLPTIKNLFDISLKYKINDVDAIVISSGPGSFTGLRIGIATAKGLSFPNNINIYYVSTLDSLRYNIDDDKRFIIPIINARCNRIFFNLGDFYKDNSIDIKDFVNVLNNYKNIKVRFVGDGCDEYYDYLKNNLTIDYVLTEKNNRYPSSVSNVLCFLDNKTINYLNYLEKPQAEKELENKKNNIFGK